MYRFTALVRHDQWDLVVTNLALLWLRFHVVFAMAHSQQHRGDNERWRHVLYNNHAAGLWNMQEVVARARLIVAGRLL